MTDEEYNQELERRVQEKDAAERRGIPLLVAAYNDLDSYHRMFPIRWVQIRGLLPLDRDEAIRAGHGEDPSAIVRAAIEEKAVREEESRGQDEGYSYYGRNSDL